jgi:hypothetical protein
MRVFPVLIVTLCLAAGSAAADDGERCGALPEAVRGKAAAIHAAAAKRDLAALKALTDPNEFSYSYGEEGGDPVAYWRALETDGTDISAVIVALLDMPCALMTYEDMEEFVWPAAAGIDYQNLSDEEKQQLSALYPGKDENFYYLEGPEVGYYVGWRLYIGADGQWTALVAGD